MNSLFRQLVIAVGGTALAIGIWALGFVMGSRGDGQQSGTESFDMVSRNSASVVHTGEAPLSALGNGTPDVPSKSNDVGEALRRVVRESSAMRRSELLAAVAGRLSVDEIKTALSELRRLPMSDQEEVTRVLFARWAELNPLDAAQHALKHEFRWPGVGAALSAWIARDSDAALKWVKSLPAGESSDGAMSQLIGVLSRKDPQAAFQLIQENPNLYSSNLYEIQHVMARWAAEDPKAAAEAAANIDNGGIRGRAIGNLAVGWANQDPDAAFQWANSLKNKESRAIALQGVFSRWAAIDASAAFEQANALTTPEDRSSALGALAMGVATNDLKRSAELVNSIPEGSARDRAADYIARKLSTSDPLSAVALARMISEPSSRQNVMEAALNGMAARDPREALSFIENLPDRDRYGRAVSSAVQRWITANPTDALLGAGLGGLSRSNRMNAVSAGASWARENPATAFSILETLPGGSTTSAVLEGVISGVALSDPRRAAELSVTKFQGQVPPESFKTIGAQLAMADPGAARDWVFHLADENKREAALTGVAAGLAYKNPTETAQWVENLPSGKMRDQGLAGFALGTVDKDPETALVWAASINDPQKRASTTQGLLEEWRRRDSKAASAWIAKNPSAVPENSQ